MTGLTVPPGQSPPIDIDKVLGDTLRRAQSEGIDFSWLPTEKLAEFRETWAKGFAASIYPDAAKREGYAPLQDPKIPPPKVDRAPIKPKILGSEGVYSVLAPVYDYFINPIWRAAAGAGQEVQSFAVRGLNTAADLGNRAVQTVGGPQYSAAQPFGSGMVDQPFRETIQTAARKIMNPSRDVDELYREELASSIRQQKLRPGYETAMAIADGAGHLYGALMPGGAVDRLTRTSQYLVGKSADMVFGKAYGDAGQRISDVVARKLLGQQGQISQGKSVDRLATLLRNSAMNSPGFGVYAGIMEEGVGGEDSLTTKARAGLWATTAYPLFELMGITARAATATALRSSQDSAIRKAAVAWVKKTGMQPLANESDEMFVARATDSFVSAGMPGAGRPNFREIGALAVEGGIEGLGFSALDIEWWHDGMAAAVDGDEKALDRFLVKTASNSIGMSLLKTGGRAVDLVRKERDLPSYSPERVRDAVGVTDADSTVRDQLSNAKEAPPQQGRIGSEEPAGRIANTEQLRLEYKEGSEPPEQSGETNPGLLRSGWRFDEAGKTLELEGTPYAFSHSKAGVDPSPALRDLLKDADWKDADRAQSAIERLSLISILQGKMVLPGDPLGTTGVYAEPWVPTGDGARPGRQLVYRMGKLLERANTPDGKWKPAESVTARTPDGIGAEQMEVVKALRDYEIMRDDLLPESRPVLQQIVNTLEMVSGERDIGVAELLRALPEGVFSPHLYGNPELADQAIMGMAHLLTTKSRMVVEGEMSAIGMRELAKKQTPAHAKTKSEFTDGLTWVERARAAKEHRAAVRTALAAGEPVSPEVLHDYPEMIRGNPEAVHGAPSEPLVEAAAKTFSEPSSRSGESGAAYIPSGAELAGAAKAVGRAAATPVLAFGRGLKEVASYLSDSHIHSAQVKEAREYGFRIADAQTKRRAETNVMKVEVQAKIQKHRKTSKRLQQVIWKRDYGVTRLQAALDEPSAKAIGAELRQTEIEREIVQDIHDLGIRQREQQGSAGGRIVNRWGLSEKAKAAIAAGSGKDYEAVKDLPKNPTQEQLGALPAWARERPPIKADPKLWRMPRTYTQQARDAIDRGEGPLFDAIVRGVQQGNGITHDLAHKRVRAMKGVIARNSSEFARDIPFVPSVVKLPDGSVGRVLETHPFKHVEASTDRAWLRAGYMDVMGPDIPVEETGDQPPWRNPTGVPAAPSQKYLDQLYVEKGHSQAEVESVANMFRALSGMRTVPLNRFLTPAFGTPEYAVGNLLSALNHLYLASKMTASAIPNALELAGASTFYLGISNTGAGVSAVVRALTNTVTFRGDGIGIIDLANELSLAGYTTRDRQNWEVVGETITEKIREGARITSQAVLEVFMFTQEMNELAMGYAAQQAVEQMRRGDGTIRMGQAAQAMGIPQDRIKPMLNGRGTDEDYGRFARGIVPFLAGGTTRVPGMHSRAQSGNIFPRIFALQGYAVTRANHIVQQIRNIKDAETAGDKAKNTAVGIGIILNAAFAGAITTAVMAAFQSGGDGVEQWAREMLTDPSTFTENVLLSNLFGGVYGTFLRNFDNLGDLTDAVVNAVPSAAVLRDGYALLAHLGGYDGADSPYLGMSNTEALGAALMRQAPLARMTAKGLFGTAALAITNDPKLDLALRTYYQWRREHAPFGEPPEREVDDFMKGMRQVQRLLREGKDPGDDKVVDALLLALSDEKRGDNRSVAQSLRTARKLTGTEWNKLTPEQQDHLQKVLGEDNLSILDAFDATLDALAREFK